ncbi:Gfo/Idh/MocA family oxidoreductase [Rhodococcus fascians]|nr:Gfo/Idh/MocA family oxidoreductase [Rhodococcus fascians]MBY3825451.1 Gfo/Idh/MocA family oxidoreductase [Rhodococcus fascians]MBY3835913.1 Gfo/Idh/MocA family oxidoreductase [Rhodococcus fascians]MBY3865125.1 Gfo/Idh/MocA family oxidoreductase [Rhodococcus fascians]MBY3884473.1 Gfo/Idh/MocA family oxidoreductase [Rhodococcus fascians]
MKIGLVGAGPWARKTQAPSLLAHPGVDFTGVWARRPDAAAELGAPVYESFDALLDAVDTVAFAVPPAVQAGFALRAARAGKHVLLDKPIAATVAEAEELAEAVTTAGVRSMVTLTLRFAPETRQFLTSTAGRPWAAGSGTWFSGATLGGAYSESQWRHDGGAILDIGPHVFDLLDAALGTIARVAYSHRDVASDSWTVLLEHEGGARSTVQLSLRTPVMPSLMRIELSGPAGVDTFTDRSTSSTDCYAVLLDEFLESVESGVDHECSVHRGLHLQRVIDRAREWAP